ncbi:UTRA domain-containing protein [Mesorhizobium sp.]|uniref:UTRA domain-containing protein n=1 Tax=Mesorhizobium sp. TaxID=1871066 RepID=UPI0025E9BD79|nr:UTRA domain-containing protein [Mesorhizobium sp.]
MLNEISANQKPEDSYPAITLDGNGPLYKQIERAVRAEILSGRWPAGHKIPSEHTLMDAFSTTRATISKALSKLTEAGMLERRRKQGTRVAQTSDSHAVIGFLDVRKDIESSGRAYRFRVLTSQEVVAGSTTAFWPAVSPGTRLLKLVAVHEGADKAEVIEERYINLVAAPDAAEADFEAETPNTWLLARLPCTRLRHTIRAAAATAEQATRLGVSRGSPLLVSLRQTWADDLPVTWVKLVYPGDRNEFVGEFNPLAP